MCSRSTTMSSSQRRSVPQGRAPPPGGGGLRCDQRPVSQAAAGLRPASWSGTGPCPARVGGTGALRRNGDFVRESVRTSVAAGVWGFSPGRLYLFSPLPLPSPWSVLFPAPIPGGAVGPKAEGGVFSCAGRHGEGQRLQGLRLLAASSGAGPDGPKPIQPPPSHRRKVSHGSVQDARYPGTREALFDGAGAQEDRRPGRAVRSAPPSRAAYGGGVLRARREAARAGSGRVLVARSGSNQHVWVVLRSLSEIINGRLLPKGLTHAPAGEAGGGRR